MIGLSLDSMEKRGRQNEQIHLVKCYIKTWIRHLQEVLLLTLWDS